ncbi:MAG: response regulator [Candidatus Zixiibacteriota bacterium]
MAQKIGVLVVDDEQIVLDSIQKHLRKEDYNLHCALSPEKGLQIMKSEDIDVVLTDLMMPEIDGLEFMKIVKNYRPNVPVIMITGYATINTALQATQLGAFDYIAKPFSRKELISVVRRAADIISGGSGGGQVLSSDEHVQQIDKDDIRSFKRIGEKCWMMLQDNGIVLMGVERRFLQAVGKVQAVFLPSKGDEVRQGSVYMQVFTPDTVSHSVLSPLSGMVTDVNQTVLDDPNKAFEDPYGDGWVIRIKPTRFDYEIKLLGL